MPSHSITSSRSRAFENLTALISAQRHSVLVPFGYAARGVESYLERTFGEVYRRYKVRTPRGFEAGTV